MRTAKLDVAPGMTGHSNLVMSSCEKRREGGGKGLLAQGAKAKRCPDHVLLANKTFERSLRKAFEKLLGVGRIFSVAIQNHNSMIRFADSREGISVSFASCDLLADFVGQ